MKRTNRLHLLFTAICCAITFTTSPYSVAVGQEVYPAGDPSVANTHAPNSVQDSPAAFPTPNDHTFVTSSGGSLDQYLTRNQVPNGKLDFEIPITRFFFYPSDPQVKFDSDGFLTSDAIAHVTANGVLPKSVLLQMRVFDVDGSASPTLTL